MLPQTAKNGMEGIELSLLRRQLANGKFSQNINAVICF